MIAVLVVRTLILIALLGTADSFAMHQNLQCFLKPNKNALEFTRVCSFFRVPARRHATVLLRQDATSSAEADRTPIAWQSRLPLARPHERAIFIFYTLIGLSLTYLTSLSRISQSKLESGLTFIWLGMILGVSFLEAWVKFKAPFLRKYVAVDVGRHVFAALNAAELALAGSFWCSRALLLNGMSVSALLPAIGTISLLIQAFWVSPLLFLRAKDKIVKGFEGNSSASQDTEKEQLEMLSNEVSGIITMPSPRHHFLYTLLEMVKAVCLGAFAFTR